jgi:hypothetical protein
MMMRAKIAIVLGLPWAWLRASPRPRRASPTRSREPATAGPGWRSRPRRGCAPAWWSVPTPGAFAGRQLRLPRTLVQLDDRTWLVADLADWTRPRGVIWKMTAAPGQPVQLQPLLTGLSLPHGLAIGPDGLAYVGEMSRIFRFDPRAADPAATVQDVITGLPDNKLHDNRHPLSQFVFAADGALLVNVGAPSDQCLDANGARVGIDHCDQSEGEEATAGHPPLRPPRAGPLGCEVHDAGARPAQLGGPGRTSVGHGAAGREQLRFRRPLEPVRGGQPHRGRPALWLALLPGHGHAHDGLGRGHGLRLQRPHPARQPCCRPTSRRCR